MNKQAKREIIYIVIILSFVAYGFRLLKMLDDPKVVSKYTVYAQTLSPTPTPEPTPEFKDEYEEKIYRIFGKDDYRIAYAIANAESHLHPDRVHSDEHEHSVGLFQINIAKNNGEGPWVHWSKIPGNDLQEKTEWLQDPDNNILMAKFIYGSSGWWPWSVFKSGAYKIFL